MIAEHVRVKIVLLALKPIPCILSAFPAVLEPFLQALRPVNHVFQDLLLPVQVPSVVILVLSVLVTLPILQDA